MMRIWLRRGWRAWALWPVSLVFRFLVALRRGLYRVGWLRSVRFATPVIVVGNLFVGGTGKTPFTICLVQALRRAGYTPGVVSRGYGARHDAPCKVDAATDARIVGDEPVLIASRVHCPVVVGRRRVAAVQALLDAYPQVDVIVADDGLQHYALARDVEIVMCDERGNGNGWLLPAGPLREPATRRRDFTVMNSTSAHWSDSARQALQTTPTMQKMQRMQTLQTIQTMRLVGGVAYRLSDPTQSVQLGDLAKKGRLLAAAGIGDPARFFAMLRAAGLAIDEMPLPDHYDFAHNPFAAVTADAILITEKDAVKCQRLDALQHDARIWVAPVDAQVDERLFEKIVEKLRGFPTT